jgi:uncharacterized protein YecE (DUF72 family)
MQSNHRHIGCSGYYYSSWKNKFYPEGLPSSRWLEYYSSVFNSLEINSTFYRQPSLAALKRYAATVPEGFLFAVKMSRYLTHVKRMTQCAEEVMQFQDLVYEGLQHTLGAFLFQMPATFTYSAENLEHILANVPAGPQNVVEFRHQSWWNHDVREALERQCITFCNVDYPGLITNFMMSTDVFYFRLHGNPELFKSRYLISELERFERNIPDETREHFIFFNNTYFEAGYTNAREMKDIIRHSKKLKHA